jgi:hypothetical protein
MNKFTTYRVCGYDDKTYCPGEKMGTRQHTTFVIVAELNLEIMTM